MNAEASERLSAYICLMVLLTGSLFAQEKHRSSYFPTNLAQQGGSVARRFDEFIIDRSLATDDMKARLDSFYDNGLKNEPASRAYIIFYRGRHLISRYTPSTVKNYLILRGLSATHIKTIYGGYRDKPTIELWIVP